MTPKFVSLVRRQSPAQVMVLASLYATLLFGQGCGPGTTKMVPGKFPEEIVYVKTPNPAVTRIHCPLLAFFGTRGDVGTEADLELIKSSIQRLPSGPGRITTVMIKNADHMYAGEEPQVAQTIAQWANSLLTPESGKVHSPER